MVKHTTGILETHTSVQQAFQDLLHRLSPYRIVQVFYGLCVKRQQDGQNIWGYIGNYPDAFMEKYIGENGIYYDSALKPFMTVGDMRPVLWGHPDEADWSSILSEGELELERLAWRCGLIHGATIPIRLDRNSALPLSAAGICADSSLDQNEWKKIWEENKWNIENILDKFHDHVVGIDGFETQLIVSMDYRDYFRRMVSDIKFGVTPDPVDKIKAAVRDDLDRTPPEQRLARLRDIYEDARIHLINALGVSRKEIKDNPLPRDRELYVNREDRREKPGDFLRRVYPEIEEKILVSHLRERDPKLVAAFYGRDPEGMSTYLITEHQYNELIRDGHPDAARQAWRIVRAKQRRRK